MIVGCCKCGVELTVALLDSERLGRGPRPRWCERCAHAGALRISRPAFVSGGWYRVGRKGRGRGLATECSRDSGEMSATIGPAGIERAQELRWRGKSIRTISAELRIEPDVIRAALEAA